jgi:RNA polymerase sigma factor (sigma-70 family)
MPTMNGDADQRRESHVRFPTTSWTLIRDAQGGPSQERKQALADLLRGYWRPLYAYFRGKRRSRADSQDLVQGFLHALVATGGIDKFERAASSRFRSWLRASARNFMLDEIRKAKAGKRKPPKGVISFADLTLANGRPFEPAEMDGSDPFTDAWRRELVDRAIKTVCEVCEESDRRVDYDLFLEYYVNDRDQQPTWKELAEKHALGDWKEAARKADWVKSKLTEAIRGAIRCYVEHEEEIDTEIRELLA